MFKLDNGSGSLAGHVVDGVLVTKPVGTLDRIVHVPPPVILVHVAKSGVNTALRSDGVTPRGEQLRYASGVEPCFRKAERRSQSRAAGSHNNRIVLVVLCAGQLIGPLGKGSTFWYSAAERHTMTGYLWLTKGDASFARRGWFAITRAVDEKRPC